MKKCGLEWSNLSVGCYVGGLCKEVWIYEFEVLIDILIIGVFVEVCLCECFYVLVFLVDDELGCYYCYLLKFELCYFEDYLVLVLEVV